MYRANGYYSPLTYFASKVRAVFLCSVLTLLITSTGSIRHPSIASRPAAGIWVDHLRLSRPSSLRRHLLEVHSHAGAIQSHDRQYRLVLVHCICQHKRRQSCRHTYHALQVSRIESTTVNCSTDGLLSLLFAGLLINRDSLNPMFQWLHTVSFFHAAYEALAVNELRYLQLKEKKYGVELDVPAATILSTFGLKAQVSDYPGLQKKVLSNISPCRRFGGQTSASWAFSLAP